MSASKRLSNLQLEVVEAAHKQCADFESEHTEESRIFFEFRIIYPPNRSKIEPRTLSGK